MTTITATVERAANPGCFIGWVHIENEDGKGIASCTDIVDCDWQARIQVKRILAKAVETVRLFEEPSVSDLSDELPR